MSLFGKKKLSLEEILKGISELSEEEKAKVLSSMQTANESVSETLDQETGKEEVSVEATQEPVGEVPMHEGTESTEGTDAESEETESVSVSAEESGESESAIDAENETPASVEETVPEAPMETPQAEEQTEQAGENYSELIAAQNAKIESLESQVTALAAKLETVVTNQDNQNFGYSPKANFDEDNSSSRYDAVMQGYAPRRADQYK